MAVSIQVDKPDIDIRVRTYDGYVEVTGIAAPLVVGDAQVVKGDLVDASPATTVLMAGDAQTTKGDAVNADRTSTPLVTGDGQTDKGSAVSADGTGAQTVVGDAETDKGEATQAEGASAPLAVGEVQTEHLKPTHRWQMPQPRNLEDYSQTFDPSTTDFQVLEGSFDGVASNVGPNGEDAYEWSMGSSGAVFRDSLGNDPNNIQNRDAYFAGGFFVRAKSGSVDLAAELRDQDGGGVNKSGPTVTVGTEWQWVEVAKDIALFEHIGIRMPNSGGSFYVLKAQLNFGLARASFTTRTDVAQTIPDVVQGADLSNGSTSGADTNDLDFGVDAEGVPYAVGDGDDKVSPISIPTVKGTYGMHVYIPSGSVGINLVNDASSGLTDRAIPFYAFFSIGSTIEVRAKDAGGTDRNVAVDGLNTGTHHTFLVTVRNGELRLNVNGTVSRNTYYGSVPSGPTEYQPIAFTSDNVGGTRGMQPEVHPVLSEAEAEAVRHRLATNPPDPVAVTEAWDTSVGSGDTLPAKRQPTNDITVGADVGWASPIGLEDLGGGSLLDDARHPTGSITRIHRLQSAQGPLMGRTVNGWVVTDTDLVVEDESGQTASSTHGLTLADDAPHVLAVVIDKEQSEARLYADGSPTPAATVGLSQVGALKSGDVNLLPNGGAITHPVVFTRVLTGEEASYAMQRLDDFSEEPFPEYVRP